MTSQICVATPKIKTVIKNNYKKNFCFTNAYKLIFYLKIMIYVHLCTVRGGNGVIIKA